jgi:hypothetical protein
VLRQICRWSGKDPGSVNESVDYSNEGEMRGQHGFGDAYLAFPNHRAVITASMAQDVEIAFAHFAVYRDAVLRCGQHLAPVLHVLIRNLACDTDWAGALNDGGAAAFEAECGHA